MLEKESPEGILMIDVDAVFHLDFGRGATCVVARDYTGQCIAPAQSFLSHVVDAPMARAYAFHEGLVIAQR
jgi:hypothetical protein